MLDALASNSHRRRGCRAIAGVDLGFLRLKGVHFKPQDPLSFAPCFRWRSTPPLISELVRVTAKLTANKKASLCGAVEVPLPDLQDCTIRRAANLDSVEVRSTHSLSIFVSKELAKSRA